MDKQLIAKASATINASVADVWDALTNPEIHVWDKCHFGLGRG